MSHKTNQRMFWFRGSTMAVGGRIVSPVCESLDAQGVCVLPPTGGFAAASASRFNYKNIVSFERAASTVSGQKVEHDGTTTGDTLATVIIEGLNVLNVITADRVVARMTSTHAEEGGSEPQALPFGSYFENLRIGGVPIELRPHPQLVGEGRYEELTRPDHSDRVSFVDAGGNPIKDAKLSAKGKSDGPHSDSERVLLAPLFNVSKDKGAALVGSEMSGAHGIRIPGFGIVYLGEYLITRASRRLTMLRIELGCPITGSIVCAHVDINGHWDP